MSHQDSDPMISLSSFASSPTSKLHSSHDPLPNSLTSNTKNNIISTSHNYHHQRQQHEDIRNKYFEKRILLSNCCGHGTAPEQTRCQLSVAGTGGELLQQQVQVHPLEAFYQDPDLQQRRPLISLHVPPTNLEGMASSSKHLLSLTPQSDAVFLAGTTSGIGAQSLEDSTSLTSTHGTQESNHHQMTSVDQSSLSLNEEIVSSTPLFGARSSFLSSTSTPRLNNRHQQPIPSQTTMNQKISDFPSQSNTLLSFEHLAGMMGEECTNYFVDLFQSSDQQE